MISLPEGRERLEGRLGMEKKPANILILEREKRVTAAIELKVPDRVPMIPSFAYFPAKMYPE